MADLIQNTTSETKYLETSLIFSLRDASGTFSVSIETIVECLQVADQLGEIPPLPEGWKAKIPDDIKIKLEF